MSKFTKGDKVRYVGGRGSGRVHEVAHAIPDDMDKILIWNHGRYVLECEADLTLVPDTVMVELSHECAKFYCRAGNRSVGNIAFADELYIACQTALEKEQG